MNSIKLWVTALGHWTIESITQLGYMVRFLLVVLLGSGQSLTRPRLVIREIYFAGFMSLIIIMVCGLFVGLILGYQGYDILRGFSSSEATGMLVAKALGRELGPVLAALLFASRAGSAMTSEIGLMKTTEQLMAMDMMAVNPISRVIAPKFWGGVISMPLLSAFFTTMGIIGGYLMVVEGIGVDAGAYWSQATASINWRIDMGCGLIKSCVFGIAVALIAVFEGYECVPTAEGISRATTRTVVKSSLAVLGLDFVLTATLF